MFEITLSLAALCGMQGLSSKPSYPNEAGGHTSWDRHALPCCHMCQTTAPSSSGSQASLGTELTLSGKEGGAIVGWSILQIPESTRETCPVRQVQWQLGVGGQVGELAVAVHDLPDRPVAAGDALGRTGQSCWLLCWICFCPGSAHQADPPERRANMLPIIRRYIMFIFKTHI